MHNADYLHLSRAPMHLVDKGAPRSAALLDAPTVIEFEFIGVAVWSEAMCQAARPAGGHIPLREPFPMRAWRLSPCAMPSNSGWLFEMAPPS